MIRSQSRAYALLALRGTLLILLSGPAIAQQGVPITQVAAGRYHTCALTTLGGAKCWGLNLYGQLGDNSTLDRPVPADVSGLTGGVAAIAAGEGHACALTTGGGVKCWGDNFTGAVGDNTGVRRLTPVDVLGLTGGVAAIAAGGYHTCALTTGGGVKCWGRNLNGELGDGSIAHRLAPVDVVGLSSGVVAIAAGLAHSCALTTGGGLKCWGYNDNGQLGDTSTTQRLTPVDVSGLGSGVSAMATGAVHTCALTTAGGVKCWGASSQGQLGDGLNANRVFPGDVLGLGAGVAAIAAGTYHGCALTTGGAVKCWGGNDEGQVGDNSNSQRPAPVDVFGLAGGVVAITAGDLHTCALTAGGNMKCWGHNAEGELGDTTAVARNTPTGVSGLSASGIAMLAAGQSHTCALTLGGGVKCWGFNNNGQLGNNSTAQSLAPIDVVGLASGVSYIASSGFHTCAVTVGGGAKCWGANFNGSLGDDTVIDRYVPTDVFGLTSGIASMTMGPTHACALATTGFASCWGGNAYGQLGDGTNNLRLRPSPVQQAGPFVSISAGYTHTCALDLGGVVHCWGVNAGGQLGVSPTLLTSRNVPGAVAGLPDIAQMEAGGDHACALTTGGGLLCWGRNNEGQLGDGSLTLRSSPVNVTGLTSGVAVLSTGDYHTCALTTAGGVKCWGDNFYAELGDGTTNDRVLPVDAVGLATGIADIDAAFTHTCALTTAGGVKCWGYNANGQLGDNSTATRSSPVNALIGGQSIAFTPPAYLAPGTPATLSATASSGLAVTFDTWTPGTCSIVGNAVTATSPGLCGLRASQAGSGLIDPAPQQSRLVPVLDPLADLDNDGIPNAVEPVEGRNPLVKDNDIFSPGTASARFFAMQQYRDFLGREGDPAGIQGWADAVSGGAWTRLQVIDAFLSSQEFAGFVAPVVRLYFAFFLRVPDYGGLTFNAGLVRSGAITIPQLADFFAASPEFQSTYGSLGNSQYVALLYQNVLGRAADAAGLAGWTALLDAGTLSRGQVMLGFSESTEFQAAAANKVFVTMMYAGMLRRTPEPAGFNGWVALLDAGTYARDQVINGFFSSTEYRARFLP